MDEKDMIEKFFAAGVLVGIIIGYVFGWWATLRSFQKNYHLVERGDEEEEVRQGP